MPEAKKHHFVPQFLLRRFAVAGTEHLHVFDKKTGKVFKARVADVAAENRLYEFPVGEFMATLEPGLAEFESKAAVVLRRVLDADVLTGLTLYERLVLAALVAQLLLRSPQQRAMVRHLTAELRAWVQQSGTNPDSVPQLKVFNRDEEKQFTVQMLYNATRELIPIIAAKAWILHSVPAGECLYTSDNSVAMHAEARPDSSGNVGLEVPGVEVYCPLDSTRCLAMYCPTVRDRLLRHYSAYVARSRAGDTTVTAPPELAVRLFEAFSSGQISPMTQESVQFVNMLQVRNSERFIFSQRDNFGLVYQMLERNPSLRTGPRPQRA